VLLPVSSGQRAKIAAASIRLVRRDRRQRPRQRLQVFDPAQAAARFGDAVAHPLGHGRSAQPGEALLRTIQPRSVSNHRAMR
jgi:hypothetical protein